MSRKNLTIFLILLTVISCNSKQEKMETMRPLTNSKDSVSVPPFQIELNLSKKAENKLKSENETVIISLEFIGTPEVHIPEKYQYEFYDELGQLTIGKKTIEVINERKLKISNCNVSKDLLKLLENKTYDVRISVVSGRKSSEDNLLDCDHIEESIEKIQNQNLIINGKLNGE